MATEKSHSYPCLQSDAMKYPTSPALSLRGGPAVGTKQPDVTDVTPLAQVPQLPPALPQPLPKGVVPLHSVCPRFSAPTSETRKRAKTERSCQNTFTCQIKVTSSRYTAQSTDRRYSRRCGSCYRASFISLDATQGRFRCRKHALGVVV